MVVVEGPRGKDLRLGDSQGEETLLGQRHLLDVNLEEGLPAGVVN